MDDCASSSEEIIRVILVDDHRSFTDALSVVLNLQSDLKVVATASTAFEVVALVGKLRTDVVLMDYHLPDQNGAEATARVKQVSPSTKVVMLTAANEDDVLLASIEAGASGYLNKEQAVDDVAETVRKAQAGDILVPRATLLRLLSRINDSVHSTRPADGLANRLTPRELTVLQEVASGGDDSIISSRLGISPLTFRTHVRNIMGKLGVHSRLEAVTLALRGRIISL